MIIGIVGKPNTGKTTFFSAATLVEAEIASYPFTTTDANRGITYVRTECPCTELNVECNPRNSQCIEGTRLVPITIIDVAGLVPGAYEGRGLGNQFLDKLRLADALIHIIDTSGGTDEEGRACEYGTHDPLEDVYFLEEELAMWLYNIIQKGWNKITRKTMLEKQKFEKLLTDLLSGVGATEHQVKSIMRKLDFPNNPNQWTDKDKHDFVEQLREVIKPMIIGANKIDLPPAEENVAKMRQALIEKYLVIPMCAEAELALRRGVEKKLLQYLPGDGDFRIFEEGKLGEDQKKALRIIREKVLEKWGSTGVQEAIDEATYDLLDMIVVYPVEDENKLTDKKGNVLPDAYLVPRGTSARELAYKIHTDLGETFIKAIDARTKIHRGEDYILKDGDIIKIVATAAIH